MSIIAAFAGIHFFGIGTLMNLGAMFDYTQLHLNAAPGWVAVSVSLIAALARCASPSLTANSIV